MLRRRKRLHSRLNKETRREKLLSAQQIRVSGVVQGVGFRPFVWRLAHEQGLNGWVRNDAQGVEIHLEGPQELLLSFPASLRRDAPPLARIDTIAVDESLVTGCDGFVILESFGGKVSTAIGHDTASCPDCLTELFEPEDRRWRYAFLTCTHCGPRYTVTRHLPYDRSQTSLADFTLCADCQREYLNPADRRFHAETTCCPVCGPRLTLCDALGNPLSGDPITETVRLLRQGAIVSVKGLGGFHLMCDATNGAAVARLRTRKVREEKPFAVLVASLAALSDYVDIGEDEAALLSSAERPIVLLKKHPDCDQRLPGVASGLLWLGAMLPTTPIQYLLFHEAAGRPSGTDWLNAPHPMVLVATSANPSGEPLVIRNDEALLRLKDIADAHLLHDRPIEVRCDDSVVRIMANTAEKSDSRLPFQFVRRARGYTPCAIKLATCGTNPNVLAFGGWFKNTICVTRGNEAFVSQHIGDLDSAATCRFHEESVARLLDLLEITPQIIAHDLHPDFYSTRAAHAFAAAHQLPLVGVQHHHAHLAAVLAEHGHTGPALGLALDGVGLGSDGEAWGGELLRVDGAVFERLGALAPLPLPGGDRAAREPWRMAAAALWKLGRGDEIATRFAGQSAASGLATILERDLRCPPTSSLGRIFDAAAALLGIRERAAFEGQAAMLLEGLAEQSLCKTPLTEAWRIIDGHNGKTLDLLPLLSALSRSSDPLNSAAQFHVTLSSALADWLLAAVKEQGISTVALSGGCFLNHFLTRELLARLNASGEPRLRILVARQLPPNDGGLSLGQAWVARHSTEI